MLVLGTTGVSQALMTFFGEDLGPGDPIPDLGPLPAHPNADAAQAAFLAFLVGVSTEGLGGVPVGTTAFSVPLPVSFVQPSGLVTVTLAGLIGIVQTDPVDRAVARLPISAPNYWISAFLPSSVSAIAFSIEFSEPQVAFGFFGIDIGDEGAQASLELTLLSGGMLSVEIPHTIGTPATTGGGGMVL